MIHSILACALSVMAMPSALAGEDEAPAKILLQGFEIGI